MAHTPTCPPSQSRMRRRPPRGPRPVPLSRDDQNRVDQLHAVSAHLRSTGVPEFADRVDFVLTKEGMAFIGRLRRESMQGQADEATVPANLPMYMDRAQRDEIKAAAKTASANLGFEAEHALKQFLVGVFTPAQSKRERRGTAAPKANLNVRVDAVLRREADKLGQALLADGELDWAPLASNVIVSWFVDRLQEGFRNPVRKKYAGMELWSAAQCAEAAGVTVAEWQQRVDEGSVPAPTWVSPDGPLWDPEDVPALPVES